MTFAPARVGGAMVQVPKPPVASGPLSPTVESALRILNKRLEESRRVLQDSEKIIICPKR